MKLKADPAKYTFSWQWNKGGSQVMQGDFGNPVSGSTAYVLCLYDQTGGTPTLKMEVAVEGMNPSWAAIRTSGWRYQNRAGNLQGVTKLYLKGGDPGKPKVQLKGVGASFPLPTPISGTEYFDQDTAVIVQLYRNDAASCWSSSFTSFKNNDGVQFKAVNP